MRYRKGTRFEGSSKTLKSPSLDATIQAFLAHHRRKGSGLRYLEELSSYLIGGGHRSTWQPLAPWCQSNGIQTVADLNRDALERYLEATRLGTTANTYFKVCALLRLFLAYVVDEGHVLSMPLHIERPKRLRSQIQVFTSEDVRRIRDVVKAQNARDWAIFMLFVDTGLRAGELCSLRLQDVHLDRQEAVVRAEVSKNKRARIVPLGASLAPIRRYLKLRGESTEQTEALLLSFYSTPVWAGGPHRETRQRVTTLALSTSPLTRTGLYQLVRVWGRLAGISEARCSPHTFRHFSPHSTFGVEATSLRCSASSDTRACR